jgi:hypothetical protein
MLLPLGRKQHSYVEGHFLCLHYALCLMRLSVVCNLILKGSSDDIPASGFLVIDTVGLRSTYFIVMPRVSLIVILVMYVRYLYSINYPTIICLSSMLYLSYGETPLVNCGPRSNFSLHCFTVYFTRIVYFYLQYYYPFTTRYAHSFVYSKPVRLTTLS